VNQKYFFKCFPRVEVFWILSRVIVYLDRLRTGYRIHRPPTDRHHNQLQQSHITTHSIFILIWNATYIVYEYPRKRLLIPQRRVGFQEYISMETSFSFISQEKCFVTSWFPRIHLHGKVFVTRSLPMGLHVTICENILCVFFGLHYYNAPPLYYTRVKKYFSVTGYCTQS
jgi:hypothetical protein